MNESLLYCDPKHWACDEMISLTGLTDHVIGAECGDNYMSQSLPYQEEIEYTRALDDQHGNSFWRPSLLQFGNGITFYLQVIKVHLINRILALSTPGGEARQAMVFLRPDGGKQ